MKINDYKGTSSTSDKPETVIPVYGAVLYIVFSLGFAASRPIKLRSSVLIPISAERSNCVFPKLSRYALTLFAMALVSGIFAPI